jgi:hypothetical protein
MPAFPPAIARTKTEPPSGYTVLDGAPEFAEDAAQSTQIWHIAPVGGVAPYRYSLPAGDGMYQLSNDTGDDVWLERGDSGTPEAGKPEAFTIRITDKWGRTFDVSSQCNVLAAGGGDVAPIYPATLTINTSDAAYTGRKLLATITPTNSPIPAELVSVVIDEGNDEDFEVEASGASIRVYASEGADLTSLIDTPQVLSVLPEHSTGVLDPIEVTINVADSSTAALRTYTIENTSDSEIPAGTVLPTRGITLRPGVLADEEWPLIKIDGVEAPASIGERSSWDHDDSWSFFVCLVRTPVAIPASGSVTMTVHPGGSEPEPASVDLDDVAGVDRKVELREATTPFLAKLNDGTPVVRVDGSAGQIVHADVLSNDGDDDHPALWVRFYAMILQDADGNFAGARLFDRVINGFAVMASGADRRVVQCSVYHGETKVRDLDGYMDTGSSVGPDINVAHGAGFFCCAVDGEYDYVPGTQAAEAPVLIKHDPEEEIATGFHVPLDPSASPPESSSVDYYPGGNAPLTTANLASTGLTDSANIGPTNEWMARYLINPSAANLRAIRVLGLVPSAWRVTYRDDVYHEPVPVNKGGNNGATGTYAGLHAPQNTWRVALGSTTWTGFTKPTTNNSRWNSEYEPSHMPTCSYGPYTVLGRPEYLDLQADIVCGVAAVQPPGTNTVVVTEPIMKNFDPGGSQRNYKVEGASTEYCSVSAIWNVNLPRLAAWNTRDLVDLYRILPDNHALKPYIRDKLIDTISCMNAINAARPQAWRDSGWYNFSIYPTDAHANDEHELTGFATMFMHNIIPLVYLRTRLPAAATWRDHGANFIKRAGQVADPAMLACFNFLVWNEDKELILDLADAAGATSGISLSWVASTGVFSWANSGNGAGLLPADGDLIGFRTSNTPAGFVTHRLYRVINAGIGDNPYAFQLAERDDDTDTPLLPGSDGGPVTGFWGHFSNMPARGSYDGDRAYITVCAGAALMYEASGASGMSTVRAQLEARRAIGLAANGATMASYARYNYLPNVLV